MKFKTHIRFIPFLLSGILGTSIGCNVKKNNKEIDESVFAEPQKQIIEIEDTTIKKIEEIDEIEVAKFDEEEISHEEESVEETEELLWYVFALENSKIYSEPNTKSDKLGLLVKGEKLEFIKELDNDWCEVYFDGRNCYIKSDDLEIVECSNTDTKIPYISRDEIGNHLEERDIVIATSTVNVRQGPSTSTKKLNKLIKGESLPLINVTDEWCEVNYYGSSAYVYREYVKISKGYYAKTEMSDMAYATSSTPLYDINTNEVLFSIPKLEALEVYGIYGDYYLVKCKGLFGFVLKDYTCSLGDKYVIIDISSQNLKMYVDDKLIVDTSIVTGKDSSPTYTGIFDIREKGENVRWDEFKVTVRYWLPFNRGEGMHDAKWRKEFGGDIYHKDGSHGCVNIPVDVMPIVFENAEVGTPVLVKK